MGRAQPLQGQSVCLPCAAGTNAPENGTDVCSQCEAGRFQEFVESTQCNECPPAFFSLRGSDSCEPCAESTFAPRPGSPQCSQCPEGTTSVNGTICACKIGSFATSAEGRKCTDCPTGAACDYLGVVLSTLPLKRGYWRPNSASATVYRYESTVNQTCTSRAFVCWGVLF